MSRTDETAVTLELRVVGRRTPDWLLRVVRVGSSLEGSVLLHLEGGGTSDRDRGHVSGEVATGGVVTLSFQPPAAGQPTLPLSFHGQETANAMVGTVVIDGRADAVRIAPIARGSRDEHGLPLVATTRTQRPAPGCSIDVTDVEFFGLANVALEQSLNDMLAHSAEHATHHCRVDAQRIAGGSTVTLLRANIVSVRRSFSAWRGEVAWPDGAPLRRTVDAVSGCELALLGDVLARGLVDAVVTSTDAAFDADARKTLEDELIAAVAAGEVGRHFGLTADSIVFDVPPFMSARGAVTEVYVRDEAFGAAFLLRASLR